MKETLMKYFNLNSEENLYTKILDNEYRHLSDEYRLDKDKMDELLHTKFYEKGKSGNEYNKQSILDLMPLKTMICIVSEFNYEVSNETLICNYQLDEGTVLMNCISKWKFENNKLRLISFHSEYL